MRKSMLSFLGEGQLQLKHLLQLQDFSLIIHQDIDKSSLEKEVRAHPQHDCPFRLAIYLLYFYRQ